MKKYIPFVLVTAVALCPTSLYAQSGEIILKGKVVAAGSGKGVKSLITYKSVPSGGLKGSFNDSTFQFSVFGSSKYLVMAVADNYIPRTILVDPKTFKGEPEVIRNIVLTPKGETIRLEHLLFEQREARIDPKSFEELDEVAALLNENKKMVVQLEGHTDSSGNPKANMELSEERVEAVKKYLVGKGVDKNRVKTKAFGGTRPLSKEKTAEARNLNRRVELRILSEK
jgi:outer membrane protein OmpA-like peptidoglycan-associated protein